MNDLDKLAIKYGADKYGKHNYTPTYYELFKDRLDFTEKDFIYTLLEIGVGEGASLNMWREFFPVNTRIYGADNDLRRVFYQPDPKFIQVYECDQTSEKDLTELARKVSMPNIVIDDGSHKPDDQIFTCLTMMGKLLDDRVTYIIEDVAEIDIIKAFYHYDARLINCGKRYDDNLIIVRHKK